MNKYFTITAIFHFLFFLTVNDVFAENNPEIVLSIDIASAKVLIDVFREERITEEKLEKLTNLHGVQAIIHQASRFDNRASLNSFKASLQNILEGKVLEEDPFEFQKVKDRLSEIRKLVQRIESNPDQFVTEIKSKLQPYTPSGLSFKVNVYLVISGSSDGWARDGNFYVALHYFRDDYEGLKLLMAHELYHVAQRHFYGYAEESQEAAISACRSLLSSTRSEGIASMVGDPLEIVNGKAYIEWFGQKFRRNLRRIEQNFALFETMLFRLYYDQDIEFGQLYPLGFSGSWDSPLYFVGYYIGRAIEKYKGRKVLVELLKDTPSVFFMNYIEIYKNDENSELVRFSNSVEKILVSL